MTRARIAILLSALTLTCATTLCAVASVFADDQQLSDAKPIAGQWRGYVTTPAGTAPVDLTIKEDGSYAIVVYIRPPVNVSGAIFEFVDGKAHFKHSDGKTTGKWTLFVDAKGSRVLKGITDDGRNSTEYSPR
jgi:hypothetical protein